MRKLIDYRFGGEQDKLIPEFKCDTRGFFNVITECRHAYIQKLCDMGLTVIFQQGEFTVIFKEGLVLIKVYQDEVYLECISVYTELRRQGHAKKMLQALKFASDETGYPITLKPSNVTGHGFNMLANHMVIELGRQKKNKIPVAGLMDYYKKQDFELVIRTKAAGTKMIYIPKDERKENRKKVEDTLVG